MTVHARLTWVEDKRFVGHASSGHAVVIDGSAEKRGSSPMELVLMGLVGCSAYDVIEILEKKKQAVTRFEVSAQAERAESIPRVYTAIHLEYVVYGHDVKPKAVEDAIALSIDRYCSVAGMLSKTATITTSYRIENDGRPAAQ